MYLPWKKGQEYNSLTRHNHRASGLISVVRTMIRILNGGGRGERGEKQRRPSIKSFGRTMHHLRSEHTRRACGLLIYINDTFHATLCYSPPGMCYIMGARTCKIAPILSSQFVSRNVFTGNILCSFNVMVLHWFYAGCLIRLAKALETFTSTRMWRGLLSYCE